MSIQLHSLALLTLTGGAALGCGSPDPATTFLARAGDLELSVEAAARLLAGEAGSR